MTIAVYLAITFGAAGIALVGRRRHGFASFAGMLGLIAAVLAAIAIDPTDVVALGGSAIAASTYARLFLVFGSVAALILGVLGLVTGSRRDAPAVSLGILGGAALALSLPDAGIAVLASTAGALVGVLLSLVPTNGRAGATIGIREVRAVIVAGAMAIAATAWIGRDLTELVAQPVVFGLAYLAFALAVAIRLGAIPFHVWAARLTESVPETSLPMVTAWGPAAFGVVALAWVDGSVAPLLVEMEGERAIILAIGVATIVLSALAALVQDDLEHVVGYSIIGDAALVLLAVAALEPQVWAPARMWILAYVVSRSAFAAWAAATRATFVTDRVADLRGWAIRAPLLAVSFVVVVVASIGLPGLAAFEARVSLVELAIGAPLWPLVFAATFLPLVYYGRIALVGVGRPDPGFGGDAELAGLPRRTPFDLTNLRASLGAYATANRAALAVILSILLAVTSLAVAAGGLGGPAAAAGLPPSVDQATEPFVPLPEPTSTPEPPVSTGSPTTSPSAPPSGSGAGPSGSDTSPNPSASPS